MSYKWEAGDFAKRPDGWIREVTVEDSNVGCLHRGFLLTDCTPVIVRPKPLPKRIKRSELRAWFERQPGAFIYASPNEWRADAANTAGVGPTLEAAILALRKALRKAGKFTP